MLNEEVCKNIFINCIVQAFTDSNLMKSINFDMGDYPLSQLTYRLMKDFDKAKKHGIADFPPYRNLDYTDSPLYTAHKAVKKEFDDLIHDIRERDRLGNDWTYKFRTFALPRNDNSILGKNRYLISRATKHFGDLVEEQLQILQMYPQLIPS